jgi:hypothetical protein
MVRARRKLEAQNLQVKQRMQVQMTQAQTTAA